MLLIDHSKTLCNGKEKADKGKEVREWREEEEDGGRRTTRYKTGTAFGSLTFWSFGDIDFIQMVSVCMHVRVQPLLTFSGQKSEVKTSSQQSDNEC